MSTPTFLEIKRLCTLPVCGTAVVLAGLLTLCACTVNVKKAGSGEDKKVDIQTPFAGIHVNEQANVADTDLPVYPGALLKEKDNSGEDKSANVNISAGKYGVHVVALEYVSDDPPEKIVAFYKGQLKKFGDVLECRTSHGGGDTSMEFGKKDSEALTCENESGGKVIELKVGTRDNQHIVSIEPAESGKGTNFGLVRVLIHGKEAA